MKWFHRTCTKANVEVVDDGMMDRAKAEDRLRTVEHRSETARSSILARHKRNHWSETIDSLLKEGRTG